MRRITAVLLVIAAIFSLCGCAGNSDEEGKMVSFYYCREDMASHVSDHVITRESRQIPKEETNLTKIMDLYLQGPRAPELKQIFPENCRIESIFWEEDLLEVCISEEIGALEGMALTVACACFAKTVMELSGAQTLRIRGSGIQLAGSEYLEMHNGNLVLEDKSAVATEPTSP